VLLVGWGGAKALPLGERTFTLCGAAEFLAPEQIAGGGYSHSVDNWALGALLQLLGTGKHAFGRAEGDELAVYERILRHREGELFGLEEAPKLRALVQRLLCPTADTRLTAADALAHGAMDVVQMQGDAALPPPLFAQAGAERLHALAEAKDEAEAEEAAEAAAEAAGADDAPPAAMPPGRRRSSLVAATKAVGLLKRANTQALLVGFGEEEEGAEEGVGEAEEATEEGAVHEAPLRARRASVGVGRLPTELLAGGAAEAQDVFAGWS